MKKAWLSFALATCLSLIGVSVCLLMHPIAVFAGDCEAQCRTGTVKCSGADCRAIDYDGCYWKVGGVERKKSCDVADDDLVFPEGGDN